MYESYRDHVREFGEKETQIDRIDNNAHYCKENCKWSTRSEQMRNRSRFVRKLTYQNQTLDLCVWARKYGMPTGTLWSRLKRGWSLEKALKNKRYEHFQS